MAFKIILLSEQAIRRINKDRFVRQNLSKYVNVIKGIFQSGRDYPTEIIGKFFISPRGRTPIRVAWIQDGDVLKICDLLYEEKAGTYVDRFNDKAREKKLTPESYSQFRPVSEFPELTAM